MLAAGILAGGMVTASGAARTAPRGPTPTSPTPVPNPFQGPFAVAGSTLVADANVFVASTPGTWPAQAPAATLMDADGQFPRNGVAASGDVIAATDGNEADVYVRPAGGWSGPTEPQATLELPFSASATFATAPAVAGHNIFVLTDWVPPDGRYREAVFVFDEPASGWAGTLRPSAELIARNGPGLVYPGPGALAVSGDEVYVGADSVNQKLVPDTAAYVFTRPQRGWVGRIGQSGTLTDTDGCMPDPDQFVTLAASGTTVAVECGGAADELDDEVALFGQPQHGWGQRTASIGDLRFPPAEGDVSSESVAIDGRALVVLSSEASSQFGQSSELFTVPEPSRGWRGFSELTTRPRYAEPTTLGSSTSLLLVENEALLEEPGEVFRALSVG